MRLIGGALLLGILVAIVVLARVGVEPVAAAFEAVGWGALLVILVRMVETSGAGIAWAWLLPAADRPPLRVFVLLRWLRESINCLLPVAQVGGDLIGARLLTFYRVGGGPAAASVVADLFVQTVTQFFFTLLGVTLLVFLVGDSAIVRWVVFGLAVLGPALVGFFLAQRFGGFKLVEALFARLARNPKWAALGGITSLHDSLQAIYRRPGALMAAVALHLVIWFVGVWEIGFALHFMGFPVDYGKALVIESLAQAVRGAAFVVPGAIGVQEGGFIALCAVFGIPASTAVALSLVKRLPEVLLGVPGLLIWQGLEGRRFLRRRDGRATHPEASFAAGSSQPGPVASR